LAKDFKKARLLRDYGITAFEHPHFDNKMRAVDIEGRVGSRLNDLVACSQLLVIQLTMLVERDYPWWN